MNGESVNQLSVTIFILVGIIVLTAGLFYLMRVLRARAADNIRNDPNPLAMWTYTPEDWQQAVADEFSWGARATHLNPSLITSLGTSCFPSNSRNVTS